MQQIESTTQNVILAGLVTGGLGWLSATELAAIGGVVLAFVSLLANIYYKHQHLKLEYMKMEQDKDKDADE